MRRRLRRVREKEEVVRAEAAAVGVAAMEAAVLEVEAGRRVAELAAAATAVAEEAVWVAGVVAEIEEAMVEGARRQAADAEIQAAAAAFLAEVVRRLGEHEEGVQEWWGWKEEQEKEEQEKEEQEDERSRIGIGRVVGHACGVDGVLASDLCLEPGASNSEREPIGTSGEEKEEEQESEEQEAEEQEMEECGQEERGAVREVQLEERYRECKINSNFPHQLLDL